ncbi:MAG: EFR1 family ferrodoxin [Proteobacteria bacterium]|nr:EFR1 family ferrodoxin [Pseudomonadota bacterium]
MDIKKVHLYYFSGTGNTLIVSRSMKEVFEKNGVETRLYAIEKEPPANVDLNTCIGLAFPVAVFTTYPLVMKFIRGLPQANGTKIFMADTMGGLSIGVRSVVKSMLVKKGYNPIAASQIIMPDNFWPSAEKEKKNPKIVNKGVDAASSYADSILKGTASWDEFPILPWISYKISQFLFTMPSFRKKVIKFNKEKCIKCGLCAKLCPVRNIVMHEHPVLDGKCEACVRCNSFCPTGALYRKKDGEHVYRAVKPEELL